MIFKISNNLFFTKNPRTQTTDLLSPLGDGQITQGIYLCFYVI